MIGELLIGLVAGVAAGLLGIGGGALFVPALVIFADLPHVEAEATSLLAILPVAVVGAWRQHHYGNLDLRGGLAMGALASGGALVGVVLANAVPQRALRIAFAVLLLVVAAQLVRSALQGEERAEATPGAPS